MGQRMPHWLKKRAGLTPNRVALSDERGQLTFAELHRRALFRANQLLELGVRSGDHVAILSQNSIPMVEVIHAVTYVGAVSVLLNTRLTVHELSWQLEDSGTTLLLFDAHHADKAGEIAVRDEAGKLSSLLIDDPRASDHRAMDPRASEIPSSRSSELTSAQIGEVDLDDPHTIIYTSGTTGHPKGVLLSYGNHWWNAMGSVLNLELHPNERWLVCVPMFHVSGLSILMRSVIYGMTAVIHQGFDAKAVTQAMMENGVTMISVVTTMISRLLDELGPRCYPASFRCMLAGGGPVPLPLLERCVEHQIPVYQTYGLTETGSQLATLAPEYMLSKLGSAGMPLFPCDLQIRRGNTVLPPNETGEIVVRGPNVSKGYYLRPRATEEAIRDGWFYSGDIGYVDEDGFLYVLDRRTDLIVSGGENVYPAEIEAVLLTHPSIADAGVVARSDARWGQVPVAYVVARVGASLSQADVTAHCRERLAAYKVPVEVYFLDSLPRNASNKLVRKTLRDLVDHRGES